MLAALAYIDGSTGEAAYASEVTLAVVVVVVGSECPCFNAFVGEGRRPPASLSHFSGDRAASSDAHVLRLCERRRLAGLRSSSEKEEEEEEEEDRALVGPLSPRGVPSMGKSVGKEWPVPPPPPPLVRACSTGVGASRPGGTKWGSEAMEQDAWPSPAYGCGEDPTEAKARTPRPGPSPRPPVAPCDSVVLRGVAWMMVVVPFSLPACWGFSFFFLGSGKG